MINRYYPDFEYPVNLERFGDFWIPRGKSDACAVAVYESLPCQEEEPIFRPELVEDVNSDQPIVHYLGALGLLKSINHMSGGTIWGTMHRLVVANYVNVYGVGQGTPDAIGYTRKGPSGYSRLPSFELQPVRC